MDNVLGDVITITLPERFHGEQAANIGWKLEESIGRNCQVVMDFSNVKYIDSSGLTVLLSVNKSVKSNEGKLILRDMNEEVRTFFAMTRLNQVFAIE
ncbi:MAG: STAS domain-containing protein [Negativicutes bacterium]|nr:STAS domain-containing protein [Negativicutes bacterium]